MCNLKKEIILINVLTTNKAQLWQLHLEVRIHMSFYVYVCMCIMLVYMYAALSVCMDHVLISVFIYFLISKILLINGDKNQVHR